MSKRKKNRPHIPAIRNPSQVSQAQTPQPTPEIESRPRPDQQLKIQAQIHHSGPLPHPAMLEAYDKILPGAADRIIAMAENNNTYIMEMDRQTLEGQFMERRIGQFFGFFLGFLGLAGSFWLASIGHDWAASILGGTTLLSLVSTFVLGRVLPGSKGKDGEGKS